MLTATWVVTMVVLGAALLRDDVILTLAGAALGLVAVTLALRVRDAAKPSPRPLVTGEPPGPGDLAR